MKPTHAESFNHPQTHTFHKTRQFKYYILNYKYLVPLRLPMLHLWRDKNLDCVTSTQKQGGFFFFKDCIVISLSFLFIY